MRQHSGARRTVSSTSAVALGPGLLIMTRSGLLWARVKLFIPGWTWIHLLKMFGYSNLFWKGPFFGVRDIGKIKKRYSLKDQL